MLTAFSIVPQVRREATTLGQPRAERHPTALRYGLPAEETLPATVDTHHGMDRHGTGLHRRRLHAGESSRTYESFLGSSRLILRLLTIISRKGIVIVA